MRMASWSSPRPDTLNWSGESVSSTRMATLPKTSRSSRSLSWRDVTKRPSVPAKGELFTLKIIEMVGSSTAMTGSGRGFSALVTLSPISMPSIPASATISPKRARSTDSRFNPSKT